MKIRELQGMNSIMTLLQLLDLLSQQKKDKLSFVTITHEKNMANDKDSEKMEIIIKYIMDNFKEDLSIKKAASIAFLNEAAFCRYFKRRAKKTFSQFVNDVRITHAYYGCLQIRIAVSVRYAMNVDIIISPILTGSSA